MRPMFQIAFLVLLSAVATASKESKLIKPQKAQTSSYANVSFVEDITNRVSNGMPAVLGQFPWHANIVIFIKDTLVSGCGGALVHPRWILTAAHCIDNRSIVKIFASLGTVDRQLDDTTKNIPVSSSFRHEGWNSYTKKNDIALLKLSSDAPLSVNVQTIPLSTSNLGDNQDVAVSGYGQTTNEPASISNTLKYALLKTISNSECLRQLGNIDDTIVCIIGENNTSPCQGDSGGPLVTGSGSTAQHVGIVSFGAQSCTSGFPVAFTRTAMFLHWITYIIEHY